MENWPKMVPAKYVDIYCYKLEIQLQNLNDDSHFWQDLHKGYKWDIIRHNKYTNDSFTKSNASFYKSCSNINEVLFSKNSTKECRNFSRSTYFQVATESYLIHRAATNNTLTKLAPNNPSSECTFEKEIRKKKTSKKKQKLITSIKNANKQIKAGSL